MDPVLLRDIARVPKLTVWKDKAAIDEVHKKALEWIKENASHTKAAAPKVEEGSVILQLK
jgi:hypothetical protein